MLNTRYRLVAPFTIEPVQTCEVVLTDTVVVRPSHLSICCADQRYYQSKRSAEAMKKKLPMALIHEGIGEVVLDKSGNFRSGTRVVMLPNQPNEVSRVRSENYLKSSQFCGSGYDGFMQELCFLPASRVIALPDTVKNEIAAFTELVSVASHAISRFEKTAHRERETLAIWGDGNLGYITSLLLRSKYPYSTIVVFGRNASKLSNFTFADHTIISDFTEKRPEIDHAFECCGGEGSASAISEIIDLIKPEGTVSLLGVSETPVPVFTRMVLEKGLRLIGSSRSSRQDFLNTIDLFHKDEKVPQYLEVLVNEVIETSTVADISKAFSRDANKQGGKTILKWDM